MNHKSYKYKEIEIKDCNSNTFITNYISKTDTRDSNLIFYCKKDCNRYIDKDVDIYTEGPETWEVNDDEASMCDKLEGCVGWIETDDEKIRFIKSQKESNIIVNDSYKCYKKS